MIKNKKKFIPIKMEDDYSYTAKEVQEFIEVAYGEHVKLKNIPINLKHVHLALEQLGYEDNEGYFITDPRNIKNKVFWRVWWSSIPTSKVE